MTRRVLITGASKGIGKATALMLAQQGFSLAVHYQSDRAGAEDTLEKISAYSKLTSLLKFDIANRQECQDVLTQDIEAHGSYYGIVGNAGICRDVVFPAMEGEDWDRVIHTDLDSFYNVIKPCVMPMIQARQGGRIVMLASVSGLMGNRGQVNYSAAKAGIIGASKALAVELAKREITVNCVAPGLINTGMLEEVVMLDEIIKHIPARRVGTPEEVAGLICYLMSDLAAYVTRQVIAIDGGLL